MTPTCLLSCGLTSLSGLLLLAACTTRHEAPDAAAGSVPVAQALEQTITLLQSGELDQALAGLETLPADAPLYAVAQLVRADLLAARKGSPDRPPLRDGDPQVAALTEDVRLRLRSEDAGPPPGTVPNTVLQLAAPYRHLVVVDLGRARLYLLENRGADGLQLVRHHYAAMGRNGTRKQERGDLRTPVGVYHITQWIPDAQLPELYGAGAFPVSYPNPWDRFMGRTGYGIWLHGVPRQTRTRPPRSSEGCVTMANEDLDWLRPYLEIGQTPVIFSDELEWVPPGEASRELDSWLARVEDWRGKWSALDTEGYLAYYGDNFTTAGMNRNQFAAHKRRVNAGKRFIDVQLRDLNVFNYPGAGEPLMLVEFTMAYRSDNYAMTTKKQQFWRRNAQGEWQIFREENR